MARCECPKVRVRRDGARLARALEGWARRIRQLEMAADVRHAGDRADDEQRKPDAARRAQSRGDTGVMYWFYSSVFGASPVGVLYACFLFTRVVLARRCVALFMHRIYLLCYALLADRVLRRADGSAAGPAARARAGRVGSSAVAVCCV